MAAATRVALGGLHSEIGKLNTAERLVRQGISEMETLLAKGTNSAHLRPRESLKLSHASALSQLGRILMARCQYGEAIECSERCTVICRAVPKDACIILSGCTVDQVTTDARSWLPSALHAAGRPAHAVDAAQQNLLHAISCGAPVDTLLEALLNHVSGLKALFVHSAEKTAPPARLAAMLADAYTCVARSRKVVDESVTLSPPQRAMWSMQIFFQTGQLASLRGNVEQEQSAFTSGLDTKLVDLASSDADGRRITASLHAALGSLFLTRKNPPQLDRAAIHLHEALQRYEREDGPHSRALVPIFGDLALCCAMTADADCSFLYAQRWAKLSEQCYGADSSCTVEARKKLTEILRLRAEDGLPATVDPSLLPAAVSTQCDRCSVRSGGTVRLSKCARCGRAHYCSKPCQSADWDRHRKTCTPALAAPISAASTPSPAAPIPVDKHWLD